MDPLAPSYPWYTPYQFAGNGPIRNSDLDGLEEKSEVEKGGYIFQGGYLPKGVTSHDFLSQKGHKDIGKGYGAVARNQLSVKAYSSIDKFNSLKQSYITNPGEVHNPNNNLAKYYPLEDPKDNDDVLAVGDFMIIDIMGPYNGAVEFTAIEVIDNDDISSFSITAVILNAGSLIPSGGAADLYKYRGYDTDAEKADVAAQTLNLNHPDAGHITFSAIYDKKNNTLTYSINHATQMGSIATAPFEGIARNMQDLNWEIVIDNVQKLITDSEKDVIYRTNSGRSMEKAKEKAIYDQGRADPRRR